MMSATSEGERTIPCSHPQVQREFNSKFMDQTNSISMRAKERDDEPIVVVEQMIDPPDDINDQDVVCTICEDMIPMSQVDSHSSICVLKR